MSDITTEVLNYTHQRSVVLLPSILDVPILSASGDAKSSSLSPGQGARDTIAGPYAAYDALCSAKSGSYSTFPGTSL